MSDYSSSDIPEFSDFVPFDVAQGSLTFENSFPLDDFSLEDLAPAAAGIYHDTMLKGVAVMAPAPAGDFFEHPALQMSSTQMMKPTLAREPKASASKIFSSALSITVTPAVVEKAFVAPEVPFLLMPTHFETELDLETISTRLEKTLFDAPGVSFECDRDNLEWSAVCMRGSLHAKFQYHVYSKTSTVFIVESNKLSGDTALFRSLFSTVKTGVLATETVVFDALQVFAAPASAPALLADNSDQMGLGPILRMARLPYVESQVEASRSICDLSTEENSQVQLCQLGVVAVLRDLLANSASECAQHHAVMTLANLSDNAACQSFVADPALLNVLIQLAADGPYQSAELRRLAVYVLANLASRMPGRVVEALGHQSVSRWVSSVDCIVDPRLRLHATRAKESLIPVVQMVC